MIQSVFHLTKQATHYADYVIDLRFRSIIDDINKNLDNNPFSSNGGSRVE